MMKTVALSAALLLLASPALAQAVTVSVGDMGAGAPTREQGVECTAFYWVQMSQADSSLADGRAAIAWVNHLTATTGLNQSQLMPELQAKRESLLISLPDPNIDRTRPIIERCAKYEKREAQPAP